MGTAAKMSATEMNATKTLLKPFTKALGQPLTKQSIRTLQINLGKRCNLACTHCHVESSSQRTEELSPQVCEQLIQVIERFPQIQVVDLTGGAPEMNYGFRPLVEAASQAGKTIMVRSNLTIFGKQDLKIYPTTLLSIRCRLWLHYPAT